jgi:phosphatidate cytidylyltransferase
MVRVISGVVLAAAFFALAWFSNTEVLLGVALLVCGLAFHEYATLAGRALGAAPAKAPALVATLALVVAVPFPLLAPIAVVSIGFVVVAIVAMLSVDRASAGAHAHDGPPADHLRHAARQAAAGVLAIVYLGLPLGTLVGVHLIGGRGAVLLLVFTVVVSDSAQYYAGRLFGRHALAPRLSPKKTIEGAIGGFVAAPVFLYLAGPYWVPVASPPAVATLGLALVAAGIAGDLFESLLKRAADMKDSSALIPGHGGILDRIDALLFATPVFYVYLRWVYDPR